jgi:DNA repair photolyase
VRQRKAIQWGGLSDPFCVYEKRFGIGLELVRFFREIDYQVTYSTKGTWWADDERYLSQFRDNPNFCLKVSIITGDDAKARAIERGVPSATERLRMIEKVAKVMPPGRVVLRFRPFIIGVSNPGHEQLIRDAASAGAAAVSTEFFCLETRCPPRVVKNYKRISDLVGYDIRAFYKQHSRGAGYLRLNRAIKRRYIDQMQEVAHASGMRFFVSDAHYKERSDGGCCCGVPEEWNYSRGQLLSAVLIAKETGLVRFSDISAELDYADTSGFRRAQGYNSQSEEKRAKFWGKSMKDFLRWNWNSPRNAQGPYYFYGGILVPDGTDENGDVVYKYDYDRAGR